MKITKKELNQLIKEEVSKQKKAIELKDKKQELLKEMEELGYEAQGQKIETYLPVFEGFYNTINLSELEQEENEVMQEKGVEYDALEVDTKGYEEEFSKKATEFIEEELKSIGMVSEIKYQNMHSPKYYNFTNDSINVEVTLSKENINNIATYIKENVENFAEYIKKHYTSRPGFSSYYSNDVSDWTGELTDNLTNFGTKPIILGSILEFICENEGINSEGMYYYAIEQVPASSFVSVKGETEEDVATETEGEEEIEEGIFTKGLKEKKEDLANEYWEKGGIWSRTINKKTNKPFVEKPSKEELSQMLIDAEPDKYEGKIGHKDGKLIYIPSKDIKWTTGSHGFGSGA